MLIPTLYDDDEVEYRHLLETSRSGTWRWSARVEITGPDAAAFTQLLTCRDLSRCAAGQCKYAPLIAPTGGIVNDPIPLRLAEDHFWLSLADSDALLYGLGVQAFAKMDVDIREPDVSPLQVQGPESKDVIRDLFGDEVALLRYYSCWQGQLDGRIPVVVSRTGWTGEVGFEINLRDSAHGLELWDRVMESGRPYEIRPIAPSDQRRLEAGIFQLRERLRGRGHAAPRHRIRAFGGVVGRFHREGSPATCGSRGRRPQARGCRDRGGALPPVAGGFLAGPRERRGRRPPHERVVLVPPQEEPSGTPGCRSGWRNRGTSSGWAPPTGPSRP